jgi:hypothetical protein
LLQSGSPVGAASALLDSSAAAIITDLKIEGMVGNE